MKKNLIAIIFIFSSCVCARAQKVEVDQTFVDDAAKAFALVVSMRDTIEKQSKQIEDLQKLAKELEKANQTPCSIAAEKVKQDLVFWTNQLTGGTKDREILKILKDVRRSGRKSIASQCGFSSQSDFMRWLDTASRFAPLLILLR